MKKLLLAIASFGLMMSTHAQVNLLNDGGFSKDTVFDASMGGQGNDWGAWSGNGGTAKVENGVCIVNPIAASDVWQMQIEQKNLALENGKSYTISFKAWAAANRTIQITLEDPSNGYRLIGVTDDENTVMGDDNIHNSKWNVDITTEPAVYTLHVTVDRIVDNTVVKFAFLLAQTNDEVYLDDVMFVESSGTKVNNVNNASFSVFPNPAKNVLFVAGKAGMKVELYNIAGSLVMSKITSTANEKMDISTLPTGLYLIKVDNQTQKLIVK